MDDMFLIKNKKRLKDFVKSHRPKYNIYIFFSSQK